MDTSSPLSLTPSSASSSPLSTLSKTPSLPGSPLMALDPSRRYPSPMSTAPSGTQSPIKLGQPMDDDDDDDDLHDKIICSGDGPPPAKKRRITPPKERTTEYLDLTKPNHELSDADNCQMDRLVAALRKKKKIVVIAGAGISVSAGIPDFRSSTGLFATARSRHKLKASGKHLFDASVYKHDDSTQSFHTMVREMAHMTSNTKPTPFHHLLASLAQEGRLMRLYSQNIDCIDTSIKPLATNVPLNPKGPWPATVQLHGGLEKMVCTKCGQLEPFKADLFEGPEAPLCDACKVDDQVRTAHAGKRSHGIGRLRPRFVLYNEYNPDEEAIGNVSSADLKARPDAVIVVGTTLKVPGTRRLVKELCQVTRGRRNGLTAWINIDSEPKGVDFKDCWDIVVRAKCDDVARLVALPPWDCNIGDDYLVSQNQERTPSTIEISLRSSPVARLKRLEQVPGIPTPTASPKIPVSKQTKLSFGKTALNENPAKASKPRGRKPKQTTKAIPPKGTAMQNFKLVKNVSGRLSGKKHTLDSSSLGYLHSKEEPGVSPSLPPLRPQRLDSGDSFLYGREVSDNKPSDLDSAPPSTPVMHQRRLSGDTISPKSVPNNMRNLIDME